MAMEQLEVPSKSYQLRWVNCAADHTISFSIKPHKKSINFGIFKHPKPNASPHDSSATLQPPSTARSDDSTHTTTQSSAKRAPERPTTSRGRSSEGDCRSRLHAAGLLDVYWHGKCEADKVATGTYKVKGQGGMFALVFDNTFSKQVAKTATVVVLTYPTNAPPPVAHNLSAGHIEGPRESQASIISGKGSNLAGNHSVESMGIHIEEDDKSSAGFFTGVLKKRKRKRHQGYARRFFSLDFTSSTLSYYLNRESSALRGAIPLSLAVISANEENHEICIDSGAEVWHLRALNSVDWHGWKDALEKAAQNASASYDKSSNLIDTAQGASALSALEERNWARVEGLLGRISGVRDAVRRLAQSAAEQQDEGHTPSPATPVTPATPNQNPNAESRRPRFWKRKQAPASAPAVNMGNVQGAGTSSVLGGAAVNLNSRQDAGRHNDMAQNLRALLGDLDSVVSEFSDLIQATRQQRAGAKRASMERPRNSLESSFSEQEFFDAEAGEEPSYGRSESRLEILNDSDGESGRKSLDSVEEEKSDDADSLASDTSDAFVELEDSSAATTPAEGGVRDLSPLPLSPVQRRANVPPATTLPPSLIGFLRKNVGKDLSTIAMPVSANEPLSLLQRSAEQLEYANLLDAATNAPAETGERILHIAAFAISSFSNVRLKDRAIRKPFNPMLGETFELVREDLGFRFISEKVCHRPVVMACHAESRNWTWSQSPRPTQKFWGKSAELNTSGRVRIALHPEGSSGEVENFSFTTATSFLRNIIAGEKYAEPVGTMTIHGETSGQKAVVTFKAGKMFSGRSEDVSVQAFDRDGGQLPLELVGKWTGSLALVQNGKEVKTIWSVGEALPESGYGFTRFAAQLNEITPIEKDRLPPTDSRLRPDQRLAEAGRLDEAEEVKTRLEQAQRERRKELEDAGEEWKARWFVKVGEREDEEVWRIVGGGKGYWAERGRGEWGTCERIFGDE